jgi:Cu2+-exporting ATPase
MATAELSCYHCGEIVPAGADFHLEIGGQQRILCCNGCLAVAGLIAGAGFENYYLHRQQLAAKASVQAISAAAAWQAIDQRPSLWGQETSSEKRDLLLQVSNIRCAACAWLIRSHLEKQIGIDAVQVDTSSGFCRIQWLPSQTRISQIARHLFELGYTPHLPTPQAEEDGRRQERVDALKRLSVAGLGMMQVMMFAVGLYAGAAWGMSEAARAFLSWVSLLVCLPVMLYSGKIFFVGAWRGIRRGRPGMDLPVALAILLAFLASCYHFFIGEGEVWFDSVVMFIFFLSLGRYVELILRQRNLLTGSAIARLLPEWAHRLDDLGRIVVIPASDLLPGDRVRVMGQAAFPADGVLLIGQTEVDESLLSGESLAISKSVGDTVIAGSINLQQAVELRVERNPDDSTVSSLGRLLLAAQSQRSQTGGDDIGGDGGLPRGLVPSFIIAVLGIALAAAWYWQIHDPAKSIAVALAVLVVSCPCALSLALPVVRSTASLSLMRQGILLTRPAALLELLEINHVVFDKTGTLTLGQPKLSRQESNPARSDVDSATALSLAAALEAHSRHAVAQAFRGITPHPAVEKVVSHAGAGLQAYWRGKTLRLGKKSFACPVTPATTSHIDQATAADPVDPLAEDDHALWLADDAGWIARFELDDALRPGADRLVKELAARAIELSICSGDSERAVRSCAGRLGVQHFRSRQTPEDKIRYINSLQSNNKKVLMIGDGVNDAPVMATANVSMSVHGATELANSAADLILTGVSLDSVGRSFSAAKKARMLVRQNLSWALLYNLSVLPLAVSGALQPWMAALGMSASSLLVVLNATRMRKEAEPQPGFKPASTAVPVRP